MPKGIVSPFSDAPKVPKTNPKEAPINQEGSSKADPPLPTVKKKSKIDLDGDSFIVRVWDAKDIKEVVKRLGQLVYAVKSDFEDDLKQFGVYYDLTPHTWTLTTPSGQFYVYVPDDGNEVDVYRRLGYAFAKLRKPLKTVLKQYGIQILERG